MEHPTPSSSDLSIQLDWINRAINGDPTAVEWIVQELTPVIQGRVARALLRYSAKSSRRSVQQEVEDLSQEVFLFLFEKDARILRSYNSKLGVPFAAFIGLVADRKVMGILRTHKRSPWTEEPTIASELEQRQNAVSTPDKGLQSNSTGSIDLEDQTASRQLLRLVVEQLNEALTPLGRYLFSLLYVEQRSVEEVSRHLGMSNEAVYAWRSRLGRKSQKVLNQIVAKESRQRVHTLGGSVNE